MVRLVLVGLIGMTVAGCDAAQRQEVPVTTASFFPVAKGKSVERCATAALAFDSNRTAEQAGVVDLACQEDLNQVSLAPACRVYATAIWVAAGKFQAAMGANAAQGEALGEAIETHKARAEEAALDCV